MTYVNDKADIPRGGEISALNHIDDILTTIGYKKVHKHTATLGDENETLWHGYERTEEGSREAVFVTDNNRIIHYNLMPHEEIYEPGLEFVKANNNRVSGFSYAVHGMVYTGIMFGSTLGMSRLPENFDEPLSALFTAGALLAGVIEGLSIGFHAGYRWLSKQDVKGYGGSRKFTYGEDAYQPLVMEFEKALSRGEPEAGEETRRPLKGTPSTPPPI